VKWNNCFIVNSLGWVIYEDVVHYSSGAVFSALSMKAVLNMLNWTDSRQVLLLFTGGNNKEKREKKWERKP
jgi:hypothetical protein